MAARVHRLRDSEDAVCPRCGCSETVTSQRPRGVCGECGWRNEAVAKRGLAPNMYSVGDHRTKASARRARVRARDLARAADPG